MKNSITRSVVVIGAATIFGGCSVVAVLTSALCLFTANSMRFDQTLLWRVFADAARLLQR